MEAQKRRASFPEITEIWKLPKIQNIILAQMIEFKDTDVFKCFEDLDHKKTIIRRDSKVNWRAVWMLEGPIELRIQDSWYYLGQSLF